MNRWLTAAFVVMAFARPLDSAVSAKDAQVASQPSAAEKTAGETMKNVQVLKEVPASEWSNVMFFIAGSLGVGCEHCHQGQAYDADTKEAKQTARRMMKMVQAINAANFDGKPVVTCNTCHRGNLRPQGVPSLWSKTPDEIAAYRQQLQDDRAAKPTASTLRTDAKAVPSESLPTVTQVFQRYRQAVGGTPITTLHLVATLVGDLQPLQRVEYDVMFPDKLAIHLSLPGGAAQNVVVNGDHGWITTPQGTRDADPATVANLKSNQLIHLVKFAEVEASGQVTGTETLGGRAYTVVEMRTPKLVRRLYFDAQTGVLYKTHLEARVASFGISPAETIFENYRDVKGVTVPLSVIGITTADRIRTDISEMQVNEPIDLIRFKPPVTLAAPGK
jgi:hypothetical protein